MEAVAPTEAPTQAPTPAPTEAPTQAPDNNETEAPTTPSPTPAPTPAATPAPTPTNETETTMEPNRRLAAGDVKIDVELHGIPDTITEDAVKNADFKTSIKSAFADAGLDGLEVT